MLHKYRLIRENEAFSELNGMVFGHKGKKKKTSLGALSVVKYKFAINNENYHSF